MRGSSSAAEVTLRKPSSAAVVERSLDEAIPSGKMRSPVLDSTSFSGMSTSAVSGMPKMIPRSAAVDRSLSPSPLPPDSTTSGSEGEDESHLGDRNKPPRRKGNKPVGNSRMSMLDFLSADPPPSVTPPPVPQLNHSASHQMSNGATTSPSSAKTAAGDHMSRPGQSAPLRPSPSRLKRTSTGIVPREAVTRLSSGPASASSITEERRDRSHLPSAPLSAGPEMTSRHRDMTAWEFLSTGNASEGTKGSTSGQGSDSEDDIDYTSPMIELKVIPVTESIIMFGSTQTSSNYSLSGKVVVQANKRRQRSSRAGISKIPPRKVSSPSEGLGRGNMFDLEAIESEARANIANQANGRHASEEDIQMRSLQVVFSGFAFYIDQTGRFSALRLANVCQELLPLGTTIPLPTKRGQEYEIEFNLSVPGWLPASLSTRFGGTFYCLEARANYQCANSQLLIPPTQLIPPRGGSRGASPSPIPSSQEGNSYESDSAGPSQYAPASRTVSKDESLKKLFAAPLKSASEGANLTVSPQNSQARPSWLSKTAKQLQIKVAKNGSPGPSSPATMNSQPSLEIMHSGGQRRASPRSSEGIIGNKDSRQSLQVQSKAKVILIGRCREVVPVPVARMAIIGPEGLPDGAMQDPPSLPRSSSVDSPSRSRSNTITSAPRRVDSPPPMPSALNAPSDPSKLAAHTSSSFTQPRTPIRGSSATQSGDTNSERPDLRSSTSRSSRSNNPFGSSSSSSIPMRHFLHRPMLHPPADAQISDADGGLPFSLTLTLPSHVSVDGPGSDILSFGVQIEVGKSAAWSKVRELGGLRLRDMELSCIQTERHSSVASRTFCNSYPLPPDPKAGPSDLPILEDYIDDGKSRSREESAKLKGGYDRAMVMDQIELAKLGKTPHPNENNVERVRTSIVGPPPNHNNQKKGEEKSKVEEREKGKGKEKDQKESTGSGAPTSKKDRRKSMPSTSNLSSSSGMLANGVGGSAEDGLTAASAERGGGDISIDTNNKRTGRGRRAYQSAIRGLSNLATAVMDISFDLEGAGYDAMDDEEGGRNKRKNEGDSNQTAIYSFTGSDGNGVDLTRGRVRMAINLPLVSSNATKARMVNTPRLIADFESPFIRARHKLKVKLGFGFGSKALGGDGDGNWGQALVMCVPVRFTDAAPREVREQFAPLPIAQVTSPAAEVPLLSRGSNVQIGVNGQPILPSYNQLFREDGSRLADEGEDLPQYPGPSGAIVGRVIAPSRGSVTAPSPLIGASLDNNNNIATIGSPDLRFGNRITPSRVVDESLPAGHSDSISRQEQQLELEEMELEEEEVQAGSGGQGRSTRDETVNIEDMDEDGFGEHESDALGIFSSSDQARSGPESDSQ